MLPSRSIRTYPLHPQKQEGEKKSKENYVHSILRTITSAKHATRAVPTVKSSFCTSSTAERVPWCAPGEIGCAPRGSSPPGFHLARRTIRQTDPVHRRRPLAPPIGQRPADRTLLALPIERSNRDVVQARKNWNNTTVLPIVTF